MGVFQKMKKELATELAWKELKEALKPIGKSSLSLSNIETKRILKHPAVITTSEFSYWELFV